MIFLIILQLFESFNVRTFEGGKYRIYSTFMQRSILTLIKRIESLVMM